MQAVAFEVTRRQLGEPYVVLDQQNLDGGRRLGHKDSIRIPRARAKGPTHFVMATISRGCALRRRSGTAWAGRRRPGRGRAHRGRIPSRRRPAASGRFWRSAATTSAPLICGMVRSTSTASIAGSAMLEAGWAVGAPRSRRSRGLRPCARRHRERSLRHRSPARCGEPVDWRPRRDRLGDRGGPQHAELGALRRAVERTRMPPPCARTMPSTAASPRPWPVCFVVKNGSNILRRVSASMPGPLSATRSRRT